MALKDSVKSAPRVSRFRRFTNKFLALLYHYFSLLKKMPGLDLYGSSPETVPASTVVSTPSADTPPETPVNESAKPNVYYNARLDPKNFLEGPLSHNPATRLRQMLARPGIVVAPGICDGISARCALEAGFDCLYQR